MDSHFNSTSMLINNEVESLENHLLLLDVDKDQPELNMNGILQHKIDAKNISLIKWSKIQSLIDATWTQNEKCYYELRIYNTEFGNATDWISQILHKIRSIANNWNSTTEIIKLKQGWFGIFFELLISKKNKDIIVQTKRCREVKIGTFGEEGSGKSTTLSVWDNEKFDNGDGLMRKFNFRFQHEIQTGKTLSISHIFYTVDEANTKIKNINTNTVMASPSISKIINWYDMGGSEKAMKTTLSLISPDYWDYAWWFTDIRQGMTENTKILFLLNNSIHIPSISWITMVDWANNIKNLQRFIESYIKHLKEMKPTLKPIVIESNKDVFNYTSNIIHDVDLNWHPILCISNVNGDGLNLLLLLLNNIPSASERAIPLVNNCFDDTGFDFISSPQSQFDVHEHFNVDGKTIIGGVVSKGKICKDQEYYFGPNKWGNFKLLKVESIHCKKKIVDIAYEGQFSSLCLIGKNYEPNEIRKGMCLLGNNTLPISVRSFTADVWIIGIEPIKEVKYKCQPVVIINHIRQVCKIINNHKSTNNNNINTLKEESYTNNSEWTTSTSRLTDWSEVGDDFKKPIKKGRVKWWREKEETFFISRHEKTEIMFEFKNTPEYITEGSNVIINDNNFKAFGIITKVFNQKW